MPLVGGILIPAAIAAGIREAVARRDELAPVAGQRPLRALARDVDSGHDPAVMVQRYRHAVDIVLERGDNGSLARDNGNAAAISDIQKRLGTID